MTPQAADVIYLESTSARTWTLTPVRPLSPSVQLTRDASSTYALKTLELRSDDHIAAAVKEAAVWRRACAADPANIVTLHDVAVRPPNVYYIMEYCPGGHLSAVRSERSALRTLAVVAAALEVVISHCDQPAHANLSATHILIDASGNPKLSGWGLPRARRVSNPKRKLTERDDVRALAAILYEMLYGRRFDVDNLKLPEAPRVSTLTAQLLRNVLYVRLKDVPELTVFRYDLAAARNLVPACTSALEPISNRRREEILDIDLDSKRGLQRTQPPRHRAERPPTVSPEPHLPIIEQRQVAEPVTNSVDPRAPAPIQSEPQPPTRINLDVDKGIDEAVRGITTGDMDAVSMDQLDYLVESCAQAEHLPDKIFKVLFRLPISKNPLVAFKAITVIHRLIADGPAKLTALAITNDGFLNWIESSWSRDRIQNKAGKVHMYSYCFSAGEVSWYSAVVRKRIEIHGRFAHIFSTNWVPRPDGLPSMKATRRDAFRLILEVVEKSSSILRKVVTAKDPAAHVKQGAVPSVIDEIWKAYRSLCWLFATAEEPLKPSLYPELELAHNAIRSAVEAVRASPSVSEKCLPHTLIELPREAPRKFDEAALVKALKKKKKKRKNKVIVSSASIVGRSKPEDTEVREDEERENGEEEEGHQANGYEELSDDCAEEKFDEKRRQEPKQNHDEEKRKVRARERGRDTIRSGNVREEQLPRQELPSPSGRKVVELRGLQKLSLSVRRGVSTNPSEAIVVSQYISDDENDLDTLDSRATPGASNQSQRRRQKSHKRSEDEDSSSESDDMEEPNSHHKAATGSSKQKKERKVKGKRHKSKKNGERDRESDSEEEYAARSKGSGLKKGQPKQSRKDSSSEDSKSSDDEETNQHNKKSRKKVSKPKHVNEKSIPFDTEHPTRRKQKTEKKKPVEEEEEYSGGSKEALEAARRGRKTPCMNPKFEVAPYEVNFGPQIGSGGFGVVYKAKFRHETVAVKKIHSHALSNAASVTEFQSEVAVLCTLRHPNILRFVGACTKPPNLMIITEFMARGTLFDLLHQTNTRVTWPMRKKVALDTCKGMRYLHDSKLLHRDLKSSNLMLDKDYNCKVGDFGLTRISKGSAAVQMTGQCGTFQYMAVEVLANKPYSEKADVFSFGILLWEMVARKLPYFGMQPMQVGIAVVQQGLRPTIPLKCPEPLAKLMRVCWDSDPTQRPSFAQLITALEAMPE